MKQTIPRRIWRLSRRSPFAYWISAFLHLVFITMIIILSEFYSSVVFWLTVWLALNYYHCARNYDVNRELVKIKIQDLERELG